MTVECELWRPGAFFGFWRDQSPLGVNDFGILCARDESDRIIDMESSIVIKGERRLIV